MNSKKIIKNITHRFLRIDKWDFLDIKKLSFITEMFLPLFIEKTESLKDIADLREKPFSRAIFRKICKARNISISIQKKEPDCNGKKSKSNLGSYSIRTDGENERIWIKSGLSKTETLLVAAHEISHFLLHKENLLKLKKEPITVLFNHPEIKGNKEWLAEVEADLLACYLLTKKEGEK